MTSDIRGRFIWYELLTSDLEAAEDYYTKVIGWRTSVFEGAGAPYTMWMNGQTPIGGVMLLPEQAKAAGAPPHWIGYVGTPDVDATAKHAADAGATILVAPQDVPTVGRFAVLQDPQGAVFSVYAPVGEHPGHQGPPQVGEFSWHELATTDHEAAFAFYSNLFGWKKTESMDMGEMGIYQMFGKGEETLGGMFNKSAEMPGPPYWLFYTKVPDISGAAESVTALGGKILTGPMEVPGGDMIVHCLDPQGALFALHASA